MEAIPETIQAQCKTYGIFDNIGILVRVMREVIPAMDYSRLSLASKCRTLPSKIPSTKAGLAR
eukprot:12662109-Prorocentrum_lima.AAC.1